MRKSSSNRSLLVQSLYLTFTPSPQAASPSRTHLTSTLEQDNGERRTRTKKQENSYLELKLRMKERRGSLILSFWEQGSFIKSSQRNLLPLHFQLRSNTLGINWTRKLKQWMKCRVWGPMWCQYRRQCHNYRTHLSLIHLLLQGDWSHLENESHLRVRMIDSLPLRRNWSETQILHEETVWTSVVALTFYRIKMTMCFKGS
jgi:hypothetical protein